MLKILDWLELQPGPDLAGALGRAGAGDDGRDWRRTLLAELAAAGNLGPRGEQTCKILGTRHGPADRRRRHPPRPGLAAGDTSPTRIADEMGRVRDPAGIAGCGSSARPGQSGRPPSLPPIERIALIMAAKGGLVADITPGDCIELLGPPGGVHRAVAEHPALARSSTSSCTPPGSSRRRPADGPDDQHPVRRAADRRAAWSTATTSPAARSATCSWTTCASASPASTTTRLTSWPTALALWFWKDLENHHPGISSLRLPPDIAAAWKQRIQRQDRPGTRRAGEAPRQRKVADDILITVRAFYLDLAQWALEDPARWGPWAVPCPIRASDIQYQKKSLPPQGPHGPADPRAAPRDARPGRRRRQEPPGRRRPPGCRPRRAAGELFTAGGQTLRRAEVRRRSPRTWAEDPQTGRRRDLTREEDNAFWAWAAIEVLRMTGIRVEELTELSHHSLVQYRLPSAGELVPLLSVAPSKTDAERLLVIAPELADALSAVISRIRGPDGTVPLAVAYDPHERTWNPPMPLLFQRRVGLENRPIPISGIRDLLAGALAAAGITGTDGKPLDFAPHDFRRIFTTDAILNGMPPHIAQLILGHHDINTTMGYKAVYPEEAINGHRAFITRRRALRPSEEYRTPTDEEWEEFLGHFERRKLALGDCGRAYGRAASMSTPA